MAKDFAKAFYAPERTCFYKGDQKNIKEIYKDINVLDMEEEE